MAAHEDACEDEEDPFWPCDSRGDDQGMGVAGNECALEEADLPCVAPRLQEAWDSCEYPDYPMNLATSEDVDNAVCAVAPAPRAETMATVLAAWTHFSDGSSCLFDPVSMREFYRRVAPAETREEASEEAVLCQQVEIPSPVSCTFISARRQLHDGM